MAETNPLFTEKPFTYKMAKNRTCEILFRGKPVKTVEGKELNKLQRVIEMDNVFELQLFLSKITGISGGN